MNRKRGRRRGAFAPSCLVPILALLVGALLTGCIRQPTPTPTPLPSPTPTPAETDPLSRVNLEVRVYLLMVRPVTTDYAILYARQQPASVLQDLVKELELIEPPADMAEAHALLKEGYQWLAEGTAILETHPKPVLRSEAIFMQDWGVRQLWEHRRVVAEYLAQAAGEQGR
ncbi:MAG: hypothetical protein QHJ81_02995 [Anaerolineae bacterium]|nr:hypothetical protein [Anaerolineae bacterium]